ncbi:MAG: HAMP domain-containing histidine kinase [Bacteroidales bacterium]|nr:HAMP domain-containing histidine kinase [Bacteroidales bacterium]
MRKPAIRLVILLGVISIIGVIAIQVYFFQITFNNEERKLNQKIQVALWEVVEQIYDLNNIEFVGDNPVFQYSSDYFVVNVNDFIDSEILEHYLLKTFEKQNIKLDFEYAIYDCQTDAMLYGRYVNLNDKKEKSSKITLQKHDEFVYYFGIYFPWRNQHILGNINSVYYLSAILIFVILFLAYALIVIMQQRRFSELQKDVVNNLTHEFKTPLSSIALSADVLQEDDITKEPDRIKNYSNIIKSQTKYLLSQVEKTLGMSEIENTNKLNKEQFNLSNHLETLVGNIQWRLEQKNGKINLNIHLHDLKIYADKFHFNNLILNIIDNAIKYNKQEPIITISTKLLKNNVLLKIADNGIGIDEKYQKRIFKKFFRVPTGNVHNVKGFGLGLSYVRDIVKQHKWKLKLESGLNKGTIISIFIPIKRKNGE